MSQLISERTAGRQFILLLLISFASWAIFLAVVGLYAVVSYSTGQRTSEFGVRLALGAQPRDLIRSVLSQGLTPALSGICIGLMASLGAVHVMDSKLFGVKSFDAPVFATVAGMLLLVSIAASMVPALRAASIDPAQTLRAE